MIDDLRLTNDDLESSAAAPQVVVSEKEKTTGEGAVAMPVALPTEPPRDERGGKPSASGLQRLMLCPGSLRAAQMCPPEKGGADAEQGTRLHKHLEECTLPEDAEEAEAVAWCQEAVRNLMDGYLGTAADPATVEYKEVRWWSRDKAFSGQPDYVALDGYGQVLIVDYKFGRGDVPPATQNLQLAALAVLALDNLHGVGDVYAAILQPFVSRSTPEVVHYTPEDLEKARTYIAKLIYAAEQDNAPMRPGEAQCKYCPASPSCPACMFALDMVSGLRGKDLVPWDEWDSGSKRKAYDVALLAERWAKKVKDAAKADLQKGIDIPGLELCAGKTSFTVQDAQGAFAILAEAIGITGDEFAGCCKVQMTPLDKLVHAKLKAQDGGQTTKASREFLRAALADVAKETTTDGSIKVKGGAA